MPSGFPHASELLGAIRPSPTKMWKCALRLWCRVNLLAVLEVPCKRVVCDNRDTEDCVESLVHCASRGCYAVHRRNIFVSCQAVLTQSFRRHRYFKILIVGDSGLGKTTLVRALLSVPGQRLELHDGVALLMKDMLRLGSHYPPATAATLSTGTPRVIGSAGRCLACYC